MRSLGVGAVMFALLMVGTACSDTPRSFDKHEFEFMMDSGWESRRQIEEITDRLARQCMEDKGFRVHPVQLPGGSLTPATSGDFEVRMGARTIFLTDEEIAEYGYGSSPTESWGYEPQGENDPYVNNGFDLLEQEAQYEYYLAYDGDFHDLYERGSDSGDMVIVGDASVSYATEGCVAEVETRIHDGRLPEFLKLGLVAMDGLTRFIIDNVDSHQDVIDAESAWLECMGRQGFNDIEETSPPLYYASDLYFDQNIYRPGDLGFAEVKATEIELAQADVECNRQVSLDEIRVEIFWDVVEEYFDQFETQLFTWSQTATEVLERAQVIMQE